MGNPIWTPPADYGVQEKLRSAKMNEQVRDMFEALHPPGKYEFFTALPTAVETVLFSGWLETNGVKVSRTTYDRLYAHYETLRVTRGSGGAVLSGGINDIVTSVLTTGYPTTWPGGASSLYPEPSVIPFSIQVDAEKMLVIARSSNTLTVVRGIEGTTPATHNTATAVSILPDLPFGSGDGATTFHLPDTHGRALWSAARVGGHADVLQLGLDDKVGLDSHRPKHRHTATIGTDNVTGFSSNVTRQALNAPTQTGLTVGPQTGVPTDAPAYLVAGIWAVAF